MSLALTNHMTGTDVIDSNQQMQIKVSSSQEITREITMSLSQEIQQFTSQEHNILLSDLDNILGHIDNDSSSQEKTKINVASNFQIVMLQLIIITTR